MAAQDGEATGAATTSVRRRSWALALLGAVMVVVGFPVPWMRFDEGAPVIVFIAGPDRGMVGEWPTALGPALVAAALLGTAAMGWRGSPALAVLLCLGIVYHYGALAEPRAGLWFGVLALGVLSLAARGRNRLGWTAAPFCLSATIVAGAYWMGPLDALRRWSVSREGVGPGWGLYAVLIGGALGAAMSVRLATTREGDGAIG